MAQRRSSTPSLFLNEMATTSSIGKVQRRLEPQPFRRCSCRRALSSQCAQPAHVAEVGDARFNCRVAQGVCVHPKTHLCAKTAKALVQAVPAVGGGCMAAVATCSSVVVSLSEELEGRGRLVVFRGGDGEVLSGTF